MMLEGRFSNNFSKSAGKEKIPEVGFGFKSTIILTVLKCVFMCHFETQSFSAATAEAAL